MPAVAVRKEETPEDKTNDGRICRIYALYDPRYPEIVRYVGKTVKKLSMRLSEHISDARREGISHKCTWIRLLLSLGISPQIRTLACVNVVEWQHHEREWIEKSKTEYLTNSTSGGDGGRDLIVSEETRRKLSDSHKGKTPTIETRLKMSAAQKTKIISEEALRRQRESNKGRMFSIEHRQNISASRKGIVFSFEHRRNIGISSKGRVISEESRKKMSVSQKERRNREKNNAI